MQAGVLQVLKVCIDCQTCSSQQHVSCQTKPQTCRGVPLLDRSCWESAAPAAKWTRAAGLSRHVLVAMLMAPAQASRVSLVHEDKPHSQRVVPSASADGRQQSHAHCCCPRRVLHYTDLSIGTQHLTDTRASHLPDQMHLNCLFTTQQQGPLPRIMAGSCLAACWHHTVHHQSGGPCGAGIQWGCHAAHSKMVVEGAIIAVLDSNVWQAEHTSKR